MRRSPGRRCGGCGSTPSHPAAARPAASRAGRRPSRRGPPRPGEPEPRHEPVRVARVHRRRGEHVGGVLLLRPGHGRLDEHPADAAPAVLRQHVQVRDVDRARSGSGEPRADQVRRGDHLVVEDRDQQPLVGLGGDPRDGAGGLLGRGDRCRSPYDGRSPPTRRAALRRPPALRRARVPGDGTTDTPSGPGRGIAGGPDIPVPGLPTRHRSPSPARSRRGERLRLYAANR